MCYVISADSNSHTHIFFKKDIHQTYYNFTAAQLRVMFSYLDMNLDKRKYSYWTFEMNTGEMDSLIINLYFIPIKVSRLTILHVQHITISF